MLDYKKIKYPKGKEKMKKVVVTTKTANAVVENGKPVIKWEEKKADYVVASTKTENKLLEELANNGELVVKSAASELFLDRAKVKNALQVIVNEEIKEKELAEKVFEFVCNVLEKGCIFKTVITRKK